MAKIIRLTRRTGRGAADVLVNLDRVAVIQPSTIGSALFTDFTGQGANLIQVTQTIEEIENLARITRSEPAV